MVFRAYRSISRNVLRTRIGQVTSIGLVVSQVALALPAPASAAIVRRTPPPPVETLQSPQPAAPDVKVNRTVPQVTPPARRPVFSPAPTADEIRRARVFAEPLVAIGPAPSAAENADLARVLAAYHEAGRPDRIAPVLEFLVRHPQSPWRAAIQLQAGTIFVRTGYISRGLRAWEEAWRLAKDATDSEGRAIADTAVTEWLDLTVRLGQVDAAEARVKELDGREIGGSAGARLRLAREGLWVLQHHHHLAVASGVLALEMILRDLNDASYQLPARLLHYHPTPAGTSLTALRDLAHDSGVSWRMAVRERRQAEFVAPSLIHLRSGHYTALLRAEGGRYLLRDPILGGDLWVTREALIDEASGYALVPEGSLPSGWRAVGDDEGMDVIGHCAPGAPAGDEPCDEGCMVGGSARGPGSSAGPGSNGPTTGPSSAGCGMAVYAFHPVKASLLVWDIPVGYTPPVGPAVHFRVSYDHREQLQPQIFTFGNVGRMWTFDWLSYVTEQPIVCPPLFGNCVPAHVKVFLRGSGAEAYTNPTAGGVYPVHQRSRAVLVRVSDEPVRYERRLRDGTVEVFGLSDSAPAGQRRVFLTQVIDPQGQALTFTYDAEFRLVAVTDAIGQVTTLSYTHPTDPLKITQVTDPFGRTATLTYSPAGQLTSVTDVIGLVSRFGYGISDFIRSLTTPYGTTSFRHETTTGYPRVIEATDPAGGTEHLEFHFQNNAFAAAEPASEVPAGFAAYNDHLDYYNTVYWDKRAWALAPGNLSQAVLTHWLLRLPLSSIYGFSVPVPHSRKRPLERRVWFAYPGQGNLHHTGTWVQPSRIGRVLEDGTSQVTEVTYNGKGQVTSIMDPLGRRTSATYAANEIDLLEVRQTTGGMNELLASYGNYTPTRLPQTITDAAGQTTTLTYNAAGQVLTVTNPNQDTTTYGYDAAGYLTTVTGAVAGAVSTVAHDGYGRPRTITGSDEYSLTVDYDLFDRPTRVTYPDGTFEAWTYARLDVATARDRLGRITRYYYDALRRPIATRDPLGRLVTQEWCGCGSLAALIDAKGQRTSWERDVLGRVTREVRANESATIFAYDQTGWLRQRTDPKGQHTEYEYFADGQLKQVAYPNAQIATPTVSFTYDAAYGRLATMTDGIGTTTYAYHPMGQLGAGLVASIDGPLTDDTLSYGYDELGRVVSRTLGSVTGTWSYDALGRLVAQGDPIGTFAYGYEGATGRLASLTYPNGQTSTYTYFGNSGDRRLQEIHHRTPAGATLSRFGYTYDPVGNITTWVQQHETTTRAYDFTYDAADQLTGAIYRTTDPVPAILKRYGYVYDAAGNRTTEQIDDAARMWTYDSLNRLVLQAGGGDMAFAGTVSEPAAVTVQGQPAVVDGTQGFRGRAVVGMATNVVEVTAIDASGNMSAVSYEVDVDAENDSFTYDANGNLTAQGSRTFEWDAANRLVALTEGNRRSEFAYDGQHRRVRIVERESGAIVRDARFVWTDTTVLEERFGAGEVNRYLLHAEQHNGIARYLTRDHLGSVREVTDATALVLTRNEYDPYGRLSRIHGSEDSRFGFTGLLHHARSGLALAVYRAYDPRLGRWLSEDPAGHIDGPNVYTYVLNRPVSMFDRYGLQAWPTNYQVVTGPYGEKRGKKTHDGADIRNPLGKPVFSTDEGVVIEAGKSSGNGGNQIRVRHEDGSISGYAHTKPLVKVGDRVLEGQHIGDSDGSGTGAPHLHLTYRRCATCPKEDPIPRLKQKDSKTNPGGASCN